MSRARAVAHAAAWRDPAAVASGWAEGGSVDPAAFRSRVTRGFWDALFRSGQTLLVSREYEHLLVALSAGREGPRVTWWPMPHPSGIAFDRARSRVHVASTRNPNQVVTFAPVTGLIRRLDTPGAARPRGRPLVPVAGRFFPGSLYLHDLAMVGGTLHANAVGENAVVKILPESTKRVWWPKCIEGRAGPLFGRNHLQLNSIAAGRDLGSSFFSASADEVGRRRPGHRDFPVDRRGVIFSGKTREPVARGLTRPHSARLDGTGRLWVANSGYGELGVVAAGKFEPVVRLAGWTRGVGIAGGVIFAGTSRVIPRFHRYAPGLDVERSIPGIHAVDLKSGRLLGTFFWPEANQIFAIEPVPRAFASGFPFSAARRRSRARDVQLFYAFSTATGRMREE